MRAIAKSPPNDPRGSEPQTTSMSMSSMPSTQPTQSSQQAQPQSNFAQQQQMVKDMPMMFRAMHQQMVANNKIAKEQMDLMNKQIAVSENERDWVKRLHDRLDTLIVENRVTNILLSDMVALQKVIINENVNTESEGLRSQAYHDVLNGK